MTKADIVNEIAQTNRIDYVGSIYGISKGFIIKRRECIPSGFR